MQLQSIEQKDRNLYLPRVNQQFIGLGHELEKHRRERRQADVEHQSIENRVMLLGKQHDKVKKDLENKKKQLDMIIYVRQRKQQEQQQKIRYNQSKFEQLQKLKKQNEVIRLIHKSNYQSNVSQIKERNHSEYTRIRQQRLDGQYIKRKNKHEDLQQKKNNWISLNIRKEKGKQKVQLFYKRKNKQHIKQYHSRINMQNQQRESRIQSIKNLEILEQSLRTQLENTSQKNSKMEEILKGISRTITPMNSTSIEAELFAGSRTKKSFRNLDMTGKEKFLTRTNSIQNQSHTRNNSLDGSGEQVEQNIELLEQKEDKNGFKLIQKRRKNKHAKRYKQYQAY